MKLLLRRDFPPSASNCRERVHNYLLEHLGAMQQSTSPSTTAGRRSSAT